MTCQDEASLRLAQLVPFVSILRCLDAIVLPSALCSSKNVTVDYEQFVIITFIMFQGDFILFTVPVIWSCYSMTVVINFAYYVCNMNAFCLMVFERELASSFSTQKVFELKISSRHEDIGLMDHRGS